MKSIGWASGFALGLIVAAAAPALGQPITGAEDGWAAIRSCAPLANDAARLACVDEVLRRAGLQPSPEARSLERKKSFGAPPPAAARPRAAAAPAPHAEAKAARATAAKAARPQDRIEVTLSRIETRGDGKLVITTAEGAVWVQVESDAVRPAPVQGGTMAIQKLPFGGYMCEPKGRAPFRCMRQS